MRVIRGSAAIEAAKLGPTAVGIGIFDGVHRGHQALLHQVLALSRQSVPGEGLRAVAYTFDPHPACVLAPHLAPRLIASLDDRLNRFADLGLDLAVVEPFDRAFANTSPEDFVRDVLVRRLQAKHVVVGAGFSFGARQSGDVRLLQRVGETYGFTAHPVNQVRVDGIVVSSTKIREFVRNGRVEGATLLLGEPFALSGIVCRGAARGASLGYPTANVQTANELVPGQGVYAVRVQGSFGCLGGMANVGVAPTFADTASAGDVKIEVHLFDYSDVGYGTVEKGEPQSQQARSLYGEQLTVAFTARLRDERRFADVPALVAQLHADAQEARSVLGLPPTPQHEMP